MKLIVGLGNPGKEYENTRHNIGFMILDNYLNDEKWKEKMNGYYVEKIINNEKVIFLKPQTFMNNSGISVSQFVNFYKMDINDILVIQDDLDIKIGQFKIKSSSSSGGHNGIKSIINYLNTNEFTRLKIGIKNNSQKNVIDFVLGKFSKDEFMLIKNNFSIYNKIINSFIKNGTKYTKEHLNDFRS